MEKKISIQDKGRKVSVPVLRFPEREALVALKELWLYERENVTPVSLKVQEN